MENHEHSDNMREHAAGPSGRAFLWGGVAAGVLLVLLLLTHGFGLFTRTAPGGGASTGVVHRGERVFIPEGSPLRQRVIVEPAQTQMRGGLVVAPGVVESDPARTVVVLPPGAGRVHEVKASLGARVHRGEVLATIDSPTLAQAYDDNDKAAALARLAARFLAYPEAQLKIGAAAQREVDQARSDNEQAVAEYARTREHLRALGGSEDAHGEGRLLIVRSPTSGSVTALSIASGATINDDTQPIMTVADLSVVWVTAMISEADVGSVRRDQDAEVALDAYPGKTLHGKVLFVSDVLEPDSRRDKTRIAFDNPDAYLKPNMFATVRLHGTPVQRVVLPASALLMNNDRTTVFVATAPWTFERRAVAPLLQESTQVTIESGVRPGEPVVVKGGILLND